MGYLVFKACELRFQAPKRLWYRGEFGVQGYGILVIWERHTCIHGQIDSAAVLCGVSEAMILCFQSGMSRFPD